MTTFRPEALSADAAADHPTATDGRAPAETRARLRRWATTASVAVASTLALVALAGWLLTGSVTILSALLDSVGDLAASSIALISVRYALRPPDRTHRFGHGKAEPLGALVQSIFIGASALFLTFESAKRLLDPEPISRPELGIAVIVVGMVITLALILFQRHVVRRTGSLAIEADALHYRGHTVMGAAIIASLWIYAETGITWVDPVVAVGIAAYWLWSARKIALSSLDVLMDREWPAEDREAVGRIVAAHPAVRGWHDLRTRSAGTTRFVELHLELDPQMTLDRAHDVTDDVEAALAHAFPDTEVTVHQEPAGLEDARLDHRIAAAE